jgi:hypothetical protein
MLSRFHQPVTQATRQLVNSVVKKSTQAAPAVGNAKIGEASEKIFAREDRYGAHNYHPLPVALCKGKGKNFDKLLRFLSFALCILLCHWTLLLGCVLLIHVTGVCMIQCIWLLVWDIDV